MASFATFLAYLNSSLFALADLMAWLAALVAHQLGGTLRCQMVSESAEGASDAAFVFVGTASCLVTCLFAVEAD